MFLGFAVSATAQIMAQGPNRVDYDNDVKAIFQRHCLTCHSANEMTNGLSLETFAGILKGGVSGEVVKSGRPTASLLYQVLAQEADGVPRMPYGQPKLSDTEIETVREWIQQGLLADATSSPIGQTADAVAFKPTKGSASGTGIMPGNLPKVAVADVVRPEPITAMAASPSAPVLAVSGHECIFLYQLTTRASLGVLPFPEGVPYVLRFSRDGKTLLAGGGRSVQFGTVVLYDVGTGRRLGSFGSERDVVLAADLSPDGKMVGLGGPMKSVKVYNVSDGRLLYQINKHTDWVTALAFSPDGALLATADRSGGVFLWDGASGAAFVSLAEHKDSVTAMSWRADSRVLATGSEDGELVVWNALDGFPIFTDSKTHVPKASGTVYGRPQSGILGVDFAPDGRLATIGRDRLIHIFNTDGKPQSASAMLPSLPTKVAESFDGKTIAAGEYDGSVLLWDGREVKTISPYVASRSTQ
jgi:mono/diheme cytochrome c family protein